MSRKPFPHLPRSVARPRVSVVGLRDSKAPHAGHLRVPHVSFDAPLTALKVDTA